MQWLTPPRKSGTFLHKRVFRVEFIITSNYIYVHTRDTTDITDSGDCRGLALSPYFASFANYFELVLFYKRYLETLRKTNIDIAWCNNKIMYLITQFMIYHEIAPE